MRRSGTFPKPRPLHRRARYRLDIALNQVGLADIDRAMDASMLSGGQQTRLALALLLIQDPEPTFLLLDEPTNNLDVEGIEWLESFLASFQGTVLISSHDRALLDNVVDTIIELEGGKAKTYGGNYSFYREQKELQREAYARMYVAQQKKIKQLEESIDAMKDRARAGEAQFSSGMPYQRRKIRKSAQQAVYRQRRLEKLLKSEHTLDKPETTIQYRLIIAGDTHTGKTAVYARDIYKSLGGRTIRSSVSIHIHGVERVWLAGSNGSGKTTLLRIMAGEIPPDRGTLEIGTNIRIGYFSQNRSDLVTTHTAVEELIKTGMSQTEAYKLAMRFHFTPDDLKKKIANLSQGQQTKLAFAKLIAGEYELLLLDEPTNHLDIATREVLEAALREYGGALLISSHDRYFLEQVGIDRTTSL